MSAAKHICDICGTSFSERWMLNRHLVIHNGVNFQSTRYWQVLREYENKIYNGVK